MNFHALALPMLNVVLPRNLSDPKCPCILPPVLVLMAGVLVSGVVSLL